MIELTRFELVMSILGIMIMVMGSFIAVLRWIYNRGSSNRALVDSVARNTEATDNLTGAVGTLSTAVSDRIKSVEDRVTYLEYDRIRFHGKDLNHDPVPHRSTNRSQRSTRRARRADRSIPARHHPSGRASCRVRSARHARHTRDSQRKPDSNH